MNVLRDDEAQVGASSGDRLKAGVAAGEQQHFHMTRENAGLGWGKGQVPLEADEVVDRTGRAAVAAQLMLSCGEEGGTGADRFVGLEGDAVGVLGQAAYGGTPADFRALCCGGIQQGFIHHVARQAERRERQGGGRGALALDQADVVDRQRAQPLRVEPE